MNQAALKEKAMLLPDRPGVYQFLNSRGHVIYVGKAKSLRSRVLSYFRSDGDGRAQVPWLMSNAADLDYIVTGTETEALLTEASLIRARQPRYNVRLKDDKRYPYIKITNEPAPRICLTRSLEDDGSRYLGPYTDVKAVRKTLAHVQRLFPLRSCKDRLTLSMNRRPCLDYQIGKCSAPCAGHITLEEYNRYVNDAVRFILGKNDGLLHDLEQRMYRASENMEFERAASLRDIIKAVRKVTQRRRMFSTDVYQADWDVINSHIIDNEACVVVMEIRDGRILGKKDYIMSGSRYSTPRELLGGFILQYYLEAASIPAEIHLPEEPDDAENIAAVLTGRAGAKVELIEPKRGEKARLVRMAALNAEMILKKRIEKRERAKDVVPGVLLALKRDLRLKDPPRTIACIDISHLQGTDTVASLVFFRDGKPEKKEYRHFKIATVDGIDDFKSMNEVVSRYFRRRLDEKRALPGLLLVDGGKGQLSSALAALRSLGLESQPVAGLAKRLEEVFIPGSSEPQNIPKTSSALHLLQRVRDEAHRFAVTYQRSRRKKRAISTTLTGIDGIGPAKAAALLRHFGSVSMVKSATEEEVATTPGISKRDAHSVYAYFNDDREGKSAEMVSEPTDGG